MTRADEFYDLMVEALPGKCERWEGAHGAKGYGVHVNTISRIVRRTHWVLGYGTAT